MTHVFFRLAVLVFLFVPATAFAQTPVQLSLSATTTATDLSESTLSISSTALLNVYEATLRFDPLDTLVRAITVSSVLCDEQFVIEQRIDNVAGEVYVACGTLTPFIGTDEAQPLLGLTYSSTASTSPFTIGEKTSFYQHDGLGTAAAFTVVE